MCPYSILAVLWLLLFPGGESRNKVNIMNGKVIRHLDIKMTQDIFWLMEGKEKGKQPYSPSLLHLLPILLFIGAPFPPPAVFLLSPNAFHLCCLFPCNLKANVERYCRLMCYLQPQFIILVHSALLPHRADLPVSKPCLFHVLWGSTHGCPTFMTINCSNKNPHI